MDDGLGGGHAGRTDSLIKSCGALGKVINLICRAQIARLRAAFLYQIGGCHISALDIVNKHTVAGSGFKIRI